MILKSTFNPILYLGYQSSLSSHTKAPDNLCTIHWETIVFEIFLLLHLRAKKVEKSYTITIQIFTEDNHSPRETTYPGSLA